MQDTLDEIQARIDAGEDFQALIDEYGEDPGMQDEPTATVGYYVSADSTVWDTAFRDAAMLLANVGDISEPVLGMSGIHIIRYEGDVTPGAVPLEEVRGQLFDEALPRRRKSTTLNCWRRGSRRLSPSTTTTTGTRPPSAARDGNRIGAQRGRHGHLPPPVHTGQGTACRQYQGVGIALTKLPAAAPVSSAALLPSCPPQPSHLHRTNAL